ncbi:MAG: twitching motility protein PilT, partial [Eubacterium sp.]|nr:twitching motility protein PilT [Eubacterium sp.]
KNCDEFIGFICGVISRDHDIETMFLDSFMTLSNLEDTPERVTECISQLRNISELTKVDFVISISRDKEELDQELHDEILISL